MSRNAESDALAELASVTIAQILRFLRFDGAVFYWLAPDLNLLWPVSRHGEARKRAAPVVPGTQLIGSAFNSAVPLAADEADIAAADESWLQEEKAKSLVLLPMHFGGEPLGIIAATSRRQIRVAPESLRGVALLVTRLATRMHATPLFVESAFQQSQTEVLTGIIAEAASGIVFDDEEICERIADAARLLTGAHSVAFSRGNQANVVSFQPKRKALRHVRTRAIARRSFARNAAARTVVRCRLRSHDLTLSLLWRSPFLPSPDLRQVATSVSHALAALDSLRCRALLGQRERRTQYVADVGRMLAISLEPSAVLEQLQTLLVPSVADWVVVDYRTPSDGEGGTLPEPELNAGQLSLKDAVDSNRGSTFNPPLDGRLAEAFSAPLTANERVTGAIHFGRSPERGSALAEDIELYGRVAALAANAIANALSFDRERSVASVLQHALLPTALPEDRRLIFDSVYVPAAAQTFVGGDWYDAYPLDANRFAVSVGDVAGHGVQASATMTLVRQTLRGAAIAGAEPGAALELADRVLRLEHDPPMVTAIHGVVDLRTNGFSYASAGHAPPLLCTADGSVSALPSGLMRPPLGIGLDHVEERRSVATATLSPGDTLVLYTDGLVEYDRNTETGEERLRELLTRLRVSEPLEGFARAVHAATFAGGSKQHDDVALLAVTLAPLHRELQWSLPALPSSVPRLRKKLRAFLKESSRNRDAQIDILTAVGEVVANSVEHAYDREGGPIVMRASYSEGAVDVEVSDLGRYKHRPSLPDRGFGTTIVRSLADDVSVSALESGTTVRLSFR